MSTDNLILENRGRVKKAQAVIMHQANGQLEASDHKLFNYLLNRAFSYLRDRRVHRIPVRDAIEFLGPTANVKVVHDSLRRLGQVSIELDYEEITGEKRHSVMHFLSFDASRAESGILHFAFDEMLLPHITDPKIFAVLSLQDVHQFKTLAGGRLYEHMMLLRRTAFHHTWKPPVKDLKKFFSVDEGMRFDNFKKRVINPAIDEVNKYAPFNVVVDYLRGEKEGTGRGRPVQLVAFTVVPKSHQDMMAPLRKAPVGKKKKSRDRNALDLFDGKTDNERGSVLVVSDAARANAQTMIEGHSFDLDQMEIAWRKDMRGRVINDPDQMFINWVAMQMEKDAKPALKSVSDDILGEFIQGDD